MPTKAEVKEHFTRNKRVYIAGGVCLAVGFSAAVFIRTHNVHVTFTDAFKLAQINSPTVNMLTHPGNAGNVIQRLEDLDMYVSQNDCVRRVGGSMNATKLSKHLRGLIPDIDGLHYKVVQRGDIF